MLLIPSVSNHSVLQSTDTQWTSGDTGINATVDQDIQVEDNRGAEQSDDSVYNLQLLNM